MEIPEAVVTEHVGKRIRGLQVAYLLVRNSSGGNNMHLSAFAQSLLNPVIIGAQKAPNRRVENYDNRVTSRRYQ